MKKAAVAALTTVLLLTGCSTAPTEHNDADSAPTTHVTSSSPTPSTKAVNPSLGTTTEPEVAATTAADNRPRGLTDRQSGEPTPIDKVVSRCARSSEGLYEQGTTWFTDGTTGWTQQCSSSFWDGPAPAYTAPAPAEPVYEPAPVPSGVQSGQYCRDNQAGQSAIDTRGNTVFCTYNPSSGRNHWG